MTSPIHVSLILRSYKVAHGSHFFDHLWKVDSYSNPSPWFVERSLFIPAQLLSENLGIPYQVRNIHISTFSADGYDFPPTFMVFDYDGIHLEVSNNITQVFVDVLLQS